MGRTRVFYGHEGVVPPTGLRSRSAATPAPADDEFTDTEREAYDAAGITIEDDGTLTQGDASADAVETEPGTEDEEPTELTAEAVELPDSSWKVPQIDEFAEKYGIEFAEGSKKPDKLAAIEEWAASLPTLADESADETEDTEQE